MATVALTQSVATGGGGTMLAASQNTGLTASTNTYTFQNDGRTLLIITKGTSAATMTVTTPATVRGVAVADPAWTIAASTAFQVAGPFPTDLYNDPATGLCSVVFSETTGLIVAAVALGA